ncbi:MAG: hypothetical protein UX92_C0003G0045 [Candidatus Amesbacteria bacterium GW2011_GWA1_47_20]|uniref:PDZ domain-containing protein n=1 Tax=Candidatus Amesbacteria bacterium GW2011_GWA1_47_20 TaxID=1618354 RepID=A0A0G1VJI4_9BACT|nr:MAG: hypothetical protein UX92_C0003G0045 [Candidatus Amesbacteria bacterium GW2011_GWA1_47_20]
MQEVIKDSPAEKVGVAEGDIIIKPKDIAGEVGKHKVGDKIEVEVWRDGESKTMTVTLEEAK